LLKRDIVSRSGIVCSQMKRSFSCANNKSQKETLARFYNQKVLHSLQIGIFMSIQGLAAKSWTCHSETLAQVALLPAFPKFIFLCIFPPSSYTSQHGWSPNFILFFLSVSFISSFEIPNRMTPRLAGRGSASPHPLERPTPPRCGRATL